MASVVSTSHCSQRPALSAPSPPLDRSPDSLSLSVPAFSSLALPSFPSPQDDEDEEEEEEEGEEEEGKDNESPEGGKKRQDRPRDAKDQPQECKQQ